MKEKVLDIEDQNAIDEIEAPHSRKVSLNNLPGSDGEHDLQDKYNTTCRAQKFYANQVLDYLNPEMERFIALQEMMFVATADRHGEADASFRAGTPGFVYVLNPKTLAYPEYRGNGVMASLGNITENAHVGLLFVDFMGAKIGLHVNGTAKIAECDELLQDASTPAGILSEIATKRPERWVLVSVREAYIHCSKHIPRLQKVPTDVQWGTDDIRAKRGDYFNAKARAKIE